MKAMVTRAVPLLHSALCTFIASNVHNDRPNTEVPLNIDGVISAGVPSLFEWQPYIFATRFQGDSARRCFRVKISQLLIPRVDRLIGPGVRTSEFSQKAHANFS